MIRDSWDTTRIYCHYNIMFIVSIGVLLTFSKVISQTTMIGAAKTICSRTTSQPFVFFWRCSFLRENDGKMTIHHDIFWGTAHHFQTHLRSLNHVIGSNKREHNHADDQPFGAINHPKWGYTVANSKPDLGSFLVDQITAIEYIINVY